MTRNALSRQAESRLQLVLQELKQAKGQVEQLEAERDENEKTILETLENNQKLKRELSALHSINISITEERDRLQLIIDGFDEHCGTEFESVLHRTSILEKELCDAHQHITQLEEAAITSATVTTQSLFDELVAVNTSLGHVSVAGCSLPTMTIDLTKDDSVCNVAASSRDSKHKLKLSKNKLRKYVKINKFIKKNKNMLKKQKKVVTKLHNKRRVLDKLELCTAQLNYNQKSYEDNMHELRCKLDQAERSLGHYISLYDKTRAETRDLNLAMDAVLSSQVSLETKILESCCCVPDCAPSATSLLDVSTSYPGIKTIMYSDELGKNMGQLLNMCMEHTVINNCLPNCNLHDIMQKVDNATYSDDCYLIICLGNRGNVNKSDLIKYLDKLCSLKVKQIVMFTFPYSDSLPQSENNLRYKLNMTLHTISCNNNIHVMDTNNFVSRNKYYLTKGKYYLSSYYKRQVANSLSYYFNITAKNLATHNASIEHYTDVSNKTLEAFPSHLN